MPEDLSNQIERLERRIEDLAATAENCRKFILGAKVALGAAAAWWLLLLVGIVDYGTTAMICTFAAFIGGVVVLGSNSSTLQQATDDMAAAEALRRELIGRTELKVVGDDDVEQDSIVPWQPKRLH